jgi:hypothetical protein
VGQPTDEADRIGDQHPAAVGQGEPTQGRIQGREELIGLENARLGQAIEERRLAGVGVADEREHRQLGLVACLAALGALDLDAVQAPIEDRHALGEETPIGLELGLARAAQTDTALLSLEMRPAPHQRVDMCLSWASSTWSLPSNERARCAKMSRIRPERSTTRHLSRRSRLRSWAGDSGWLKIARSAPVAATSATSSSHLPVPMKSLGSGGARAAQRADDLGAGCLRQALETPRARPARPLNRYPDAPKRRARRRSGRSNTGNPCRRNESRDRAGFITAGSIDHALPGSGGSSVGGGNLTLRAGTTVEMACL